MAKTKAEMAKRIKELEEQRSTQFRAIKEWEENYNAKVQELAAMSERADKNKAMFDKLLDRKLELEREHQDAVQQRDQWKAFHDAEEKGRIKAQRALDESRRDVHRLTSVLGNMAKEARDNDLPF